LAVVKAKEQARAAAEAERSSVTSQLKEIELESKRQLAEISKKLDSAKLSLSMRDQTVDSLEKERNSLSKKVEDLEMEKTKNFTDMASKIEIFSNMKIQAEKELRSLQNKLETCNLENNKVVSELQHSLATMAKEKSIAENDRRSAEMKVLASESEKNRYLTEATKKLDSLSAFATQTEKVRQNLEVQNQNMMKERKVLDTKISLLESERQNMIAELKSKSISLSELEKVLFESQRTSGEYESRIKSLENRLGTSEGSRNNLLAEVAKKSDAISNLHKEKSSLESQIAIMKKNKQLADTANEKRMEEMNGVLAAKTAAIKRNENLIGELQQDLDAARSRLAAVNSLSVQNVDLLEQIRVLKEAAAAGKKDFDAELTRVKEEARLDGFNAMKKLNLLEMELDFNRKASEKMRYDLTEQISNLRRECSSYSEKCNIMNDENSSLSAKSKILAQKLFELEKKYVEMSEDCKNRKIELDQREVQIKKLEENYRTAPPKLIDPSLKKDRDEALALVRQQKSDMAGMKDELLRLSQKLTLAEMLIKDLEKDKEMLNESQRELKANFLANLNSQEDRFHTELIEKNARIRELEEILTNKIKM
jgi:chromosome segregation ATPase